MMGAVGADSIIAGLLGWLAAWRVDGEMEPEAAKVPGAMISVAGEELVLDGQPAPLPEPEVCRGGDGPLSPLNCGCAVRGGSGSACCPVLVEESLQPGHCICSLA